MRGPKGPFPLSSKHVDLSTVWIVSSPSLKGNDMKLSDKAQNFLLAGAILGMFAGGYSSMWAVGEQKVAGLIAQEMAGRDYRMTYLMKQERTRDDNTQKEVCAEEGKSPGRCKIESDYRWALWEWQDCTAVGNGPEICRTKPEEPR